MVKLRRLIQLLCAFFANANVKGMFTGTIYKGPLKYVCFPGLNCYSCPAALGACPLGSLQTVLGFSPIIASAYVVGFLTAAGALFGRFICGFICPFGLFQELLHLVPSRKFNFPSAYLRLKYIFLIAFVVLIPIYTYVTKGYGVTAFCKYICPSGTLFAGFPLLLTNSGLRQGAGLLFFIKAFIGVLIVVLSVLIFRPFCKYICPLGAIYGFFNKYSIIALEYNNNKCINCGRCKKACKISEEIDGSSPECIRCLKCAATCERNAINVVYRGVLPKGYKTNRSFFK